MRKITIGIWFFLIFVSSLFIISGCVSSDHLDNAASNSHSLKAAADACQAGQMIRNGECADPQDINKESEMGNDAEKTDDCMNLCPEHTVCHRRECIPEGSCEINPCPPTDICVNHECVEPRSMLECDGRCEEGMTCHRNRCIPETSCEINPCHPAYICINHQCVQ